jgi:hypothetical protein
MNEKIHILEIQYGGETSRMYFHNKDNAINVTKEITEMVKEDNGKLFTSTIVVSVHNEYTMDQIPLQMIKHILKGAYSEYTNGRSEN